MMGGMGMSEEWMSVPWVRRWGEGGEEWWRVEGGCGEEGGR